MKVKIILLTICCTIFINLTAYADSQKTARKKTSRIVNGSQCNSGECTGVAALVDPDTRPYHVFCGGTLIHPKWVLTAAHCIEDETLSSFQVVTGMHNTQQDIGEQINVKRIIPHPNYNPYTLESDIALLELTDPSSSTPIAVYRGDSTLEGESSVVMGWGKLYDSGPLPENLLQATIPIVSNQICSQAYWPDDEVTDTMLCAGNNGKDSCQGDSGGPLVVEYNNVLLLIGIVSWGQGCAEPGYYGVYTRVSKFIQFIDQYVSTNFTQIKLYKGWNLISLSINPLNSELNALFPEAVQAYKYLSTGYMPATRLVPGQGYWVYMPITKTYTINGYPVTDISFSTEKGWHLIGTVNGQCIPDNVAEPDGQIFQYAGGAYLAVDKCLPNKGYWVHYE